MESEEKLVYEKPTLTKHAQLREVTLSSTGGRGNDNGNNENNGNGNGNNGNGNGNG